MRAALFIFFLIFPLQLFAAPGNCTYTTYKWNVYLKRAVDIQSIQIPYTQLAAEQIDERTGCTVCEEDQSIIRLPGINPFKICKEMAARVTDALTQALLAGETIKAVQGYRVGMTKGDIDHEGNRTVFSNHSFGTAIDINPELNGLYDNCIKFTPSCHLRKGGPWHPGMPGSITKDSVLVQAMEKLGMQWGGRIAGKQKDFMHFSLTGY